jgi:hypothetical protein
VKFEKTVKETQKKIARSSPPLCEGQGVWRLACACVCVCKAKKKVLVVQSARLAV